MNKIIKIMISLLCISCLSFNATADLDQVPLPSNTDIRMQLDDEYPMILNGFVKMSDTEVIEFYTNQLGTADRMIEDIGRYTFFYSQAHRQLKISIYQQDEWTEISVMITE